MLAEVNDVVRVRHPFMRGREWLVRKVFQSLDPDILLYRISLLNQDGSISTMNDITVHSGYFHENLGGYDEWLQLNKN